MLHNILPDEIATRLKDSLAMIADAFASASVLFADVVDFTPLSAGMAPSELVTLLDAVFTVFDGFVAELGLEKIKTIGDAYMVASGVPLPRADHAEAIAELALRMRDHSASSEFGGRSIRLRIGINSGPVVAGIIGSHKFAYDLWGDAVNTASRMESTGVPGQIQVTPSTYELIKERFVCEPRGVISVKGKGPGNVSLFRDARVWVHRREVEYALAERLTRTDYVGPYVTEDWLLEGLNWRFVYGPAAITTEVKLIPMAGHTPGTLCMEVVTESRRLVFPSDSMYAAENMGPPVRLPGVIHDSVGFRETADRLAFLRDETGALVIYPHDPAQFETIMTAPQWYE